MVMGIATRTPPAQNMVYEVPMDVLAVHVHNPTATFIPALLPWEMYLANMKSPHGAMNAVSTVYMTIGFDKGSIIFVRT